MAGGLLESHKTTAKIVLTRPHQLPRQHSHHGAHTWPQVLCFEEKKADSPAKLYVMEVGRDKDAPGGVFRLSPQQIPNAADAPNDFPVAMQVGEGA